MSGVLPFRASDGVPVPVAISAWSGAAVLVAIALLTVGAEHDVHANDDGSAAAASPSIGARDDILPDGRRVEGALYHVGDHVRASLPMRHEPSIYGWGTVRLDAEPLEDEVTVRTIVDAPTASRRWTAACDVVLDIDGHEVRARAQPVGTRLKSGVYYDAVRFDLGIDTIRRLARAVRVEGSVCGDPLTMPDAQRTTLGSFVEAFDDLALPVMPSVETELEIMPSDPDEVVDDPDTYLEPA